MTTIVHKIKCDSCGKVLDALGWDRWHLIDSDASLLVDYHLCARCFEDKICKEEKELDQ
jgi:hypothetical protein